eukprot:Protomagalhaensia_wolfi_Nauph_80__5778@NODE_710_length_2084_cov_64_216137_g504_i1_p2_GENE_NODE_710_length_2084_cov_64_216137_g504_i1NODE_710_length_2084_cov_64_216137_g504_i1_p2_ORF_typecomplete_len174_score20_67Zn_Tnp_IS1595/PF12760_7/0_035Znribbon_8/PF09723_10/92Znribbon_8/PF09723_10/3_5_NODE_710_length_2084_cov_64_216137_g504_i196617
MSDSSETERGGYYQRLSLGDDGETPRQPNRPRDHVMISADVLDILAPVDSTSRKEFENTAEHGMAQYQYRRPYQTTGVVYVDDEYPPAQCILCQERPLRRIDPPACCQSAPPGIICPHCGSNIHKRKLFNGLLRCNLLLSLMSFLCLAVNPVCWCVTIFLVLLLFLAGNSDVK